MIPGCTLCYCHIHIHVNTHEFALCYYHNCIKPLYMYHVIATIKTLLLSYPYLCVLLPPSHYCHHTYIYIVLLPTITLLPSYFILCIVLFSPSYYYHHIFIYALCYCHHHNYYIAIASISALCYFHTTLLPSYMYLHYVIATITLPSNLYNMHCTIVTMLLPSYMYMHDDIMTITAFSSNLYLSIM